MVMRERMAVVVFMQEKAVDGVRFFTTEDEKEGVAEVTGQSGKVNWGLCNALLVALSTVLSGHALNELVLPLLSAAKSHLQRDLAERGLLDIDTFSEAPF